MDLKWAALLKLASGKPVMRKSIEEALTKAGRLETDASFGKVEKDTMLVKFGLEEDQLKVL